MPAVYTQMDDDYVYIRVTREKVVPVGTGFIETVQHHVSQSAGPEIPHQSFNQFRCSCRHPRRSSGLEIRR